MSVQILESSIVYYTMHRTILDEKAQAELEIQQINNAIAKAQDQVKKIIESKKQLSLTLSMQQIDLGTLNSISKDQNLSLQKEIEAIDLSINDLHSKINILFSLAQPFFQKVFFAEDYLKNTTYQSKISFLQAPSNISSYNKLYRQSLN